MKKISFGKSEISLFALMLTFALNFSVFYHEVAAQRRKVKTGISKTVASGKSPAIVQPNKISDNFDADEFETFTLVNVERNRRGLNQLTWDDAVADIARDYSKRMASENFFGHYDADGKNALDRVKAAHLKHWSKIGENLFSIENLARFDAFAVENWMKSPSHRDNILAQDWTTTGIGIAKSKDGEIFITQIFIKR